MALVDEVTTRIADTLLRQLTNQSKTGNQSVDATVLAAAADDAEAEFALETGVTYDNSVAAHVAAGVKGTLFYLHEYTEAGSAAQDRRRVRWENLLRKIEGTIGAGTKVVPASTSPLEESIQEGNTRPDFDRERWDDVVPDMPRGGEIEDNRRGR